MQPSIAVTLQCVLENLEEIAFPQLQEEHAQSVARCTSILLRVVLQRLAHEPPMLVADSREKRELFAAMLAELSADTPAELIATLDDLQAAAAEPALPLVTTDLLTLENLRLKAVLDRAITALHARREALGEARFATLRSHLRVQLRAQIDREAALVREPYAGPGFPY